jgi:hypothetical protein
MPLSSILARFRKSTRKYINRRRVSPFVAIKAEQTQPPTVCNFQRYPRRPLAKNLRQISGSTFSTPYLAPESLTGATLGTPPDVVETFVPEVTLEPPQENGYRSLLPEDAIPNLQDTLASCGQLMISLR